MSKDTHLIFYHRFCSDGTASKDILRDAILFNNSIPEPNIIAIPINQLNMTAEKLSEKLKKIDSVDNVIIYTLDVAPDPDRAFHWFKTALEHQQVKAVHLVDHHVSVSQEDIVELQKLAGQSKCFNTNHYNPEEINQKYSKAGTMLTLDLGYELIKSSYSDHEAEELKNKWYDFASIVSYADLVCSNNYSSELKDKVANIVSQTLDSKNSAVQDKVLELEQVRTLDNIETDKIEAILFAVDSAIMSKCLTKTSTPTAPWNDYWNIEHCFINLNISSFAKAMHNTQIYAHKNAIVYTLTAAPISDEIKKLWERDNVKFILETQGAPENTLRSSDSELEKHLLTHITEDELRYSMSISIKHSKENKLVTEEGEANIINSWSKNQEYHELIAVSIRRFGTNSCVNLDALKNHTNEVNSAYGDHQTMLGGRGNAVGGFLHQECIKDHLQTHQYYTDLNANAKSTLIGELGSD